MRFSFSALISSNIAPRHPGWHKASLTVFGTEIVNSSNQWARWMWHAIIRDINDNRICNFGKGALTSTFLKINKVIITDKWTLIRLWRSWIIWVRIKQHNFYMWYILNFSGLNNWRRIGGLCGGWGISVAYSVRSLSCCSIGAVMTLYTNHSSSSTLVGATDWYQNGVVSENVTSIDTKYWLRVEE